MKKKILKKKIKKCNKDNQSDCCCINSLQKYYDYLKEYNKNNDKEFVKGEKPKYHN